MLVACCWQPVLNKETKRSLFWKKGRSLCYIKSGSIVGRQIQSKVNNHGWMVQPQLISFICVNLCLSAYICGKKKTISRAADDNGLTLIHAEVEKRDRNNSDANRFDIICQLSVDCWRLSVFSGYKLQITNYHYSINPNFCKRERMAPGCRWNLWANSPISWQLAYSFFKFSSSSWLHLT